MNLYIETSVWNMLLDEEGVNQGKRDITGALMAEGRRGKHRLFVSPLVLTEIAADPDAKHRAALQATLENFGVAILEESEAVLELGHNYVEAGIVPEKYEDDAVHIAYAVVNRLDAIISWNMQHIVKVRTRKHISQYNTGQGLHVPDLATPEEVVEDVETDGATS